MDLRIVELYVIYRGILDDESVCRLVFTNAPDEIIKDICRDIKKDKILNRSNGIAGIIGILKSRGYECHTIDNIPRFGFTES